MADTKAARRKRLAYIRKLWARAKRPVRAVTKWAKQRQRVLRFSSLQRFARQQQEAAQTARARAKWKALRYRWKKKVDYLESHADDSAPSGGIAYFDGKPVAAWIVPWLEKSRRNGWNGSLVSGYRSPEYSESLCRAICGAPSCPGTCAGRNSNHTRLGPGEGAVDVSDAYTFALVQRRIGSPLRNNLPADRVHFSASGV